MKQTTIHYKTSNTLINRLKARDDIKILKKSSFITKFFSKKRYSDIYFHSGELDENSIDFIKNSLWGGVSKSMLKKTIWLLIK